MNELQVTEYKDIRVLTTQQIAEAYETNADIISRNFANNKIRYIEGKHFIRLVGDELREAKANGKIYGLPQNANKFYLWTEKGALLHAKSLNTDRAWQAYDYLVDSYFKKQESTDLSDLSVELQAIIMHDKKIQRIETRMDRLEFDIPLYGSEADDLCNHVKRKGVEVMGSKKSNAYQDTKIRTAVYTDIYNQIKREFGLYDDKGRYTSYKALKRKYIKEAHGLIDSYEPPTYLRERIEDCNAQISLGGEVA